MNGLKPILQVDLANERTGDNAKSGLRPRLTNATGRYFNAWEYG